MPNLIPGVDLIGIITKRGLTPLAFAAVSITTLFAIAFFVYDAIVCHRNSDGNRALTVTALIALTIVLSISVFSFCNVKTQYVVQVDETVNIEELSEQYEIVGHVNDKYIIEIPKGGNPNV